MDMRETINNIEEEQIMQLSFIHADREYSPARTLVLAGALGSDTEFGKVLFIDYQNRHMSIK